MEEKQTPSDETKEEVKVETKEAKKDAIVIKKKTIVFILIYLFIVIMAIDYIYVKWNTMLHPSHTTINGYNAKMTRYEETPVDIPKKIDIEIGFYRRFAKFECENGCMFVKSQDELAGELNRIVHFRDEEERINGEEYISGLLDQFNSEFFQDYDLAIIYFNDRKDENFDIRSITKEGNTLTFNMGRNIIRDAGYAGMPIVNYSRTNPGDNVTMVIISLDKGAENVEFNLYEPIPWKSVDGFAIDMFATAVYLEFLILTITFVKNYNKAVEKKQTKKAAILKSIGTGLLGVLILALIGVFIHLSSRPIVQDSMVKPIIYIYPEEETLVNVKLGKPEKITCDYPEYEKDGWEVKAKPNGDLKYLKTGRNLYALYYESDSTVNAKIEKDGFIVKGEDASRFLEEKLEILGLNEREAEEFIVYWLPILEENKYNYIRFETEEEINVNMPLEITPEPDSIIRVMMTYKGLDRPIDVEEQKLTTPERKGFTVVEWGGTKIER